MDPARRAFYRYHASLMEPWDGPAAVAFTDGTVVGAVLDRNGLRPARYWVTDDGLVVLASEVGVLDLAPSTSCARAACSPDGCSWSTRPRDASSTTTRSRRSWPPSTPTASGSRRTRSHLDDLPARAMLTPQHASRGQPPAPVRLHHRGAARSSSAPMARTGAEPIGSMGSDTAIAVLSDRPRLLYDYFTQLFAQVTNPPLDAIREELVTSLAATVGPEGNLLEAAQGSCRQILLPHAGASTTTTWPSSCTSTSTARRRASRPSPSTASSRSRGGRRGALRQGGATGDDVPCAGRCRAAIADGANVIVLSDRNATTELAPIPSLLLVAAVHHHLVREKTRTRVGLVVETGDAREVHHMALLIGFGAAAVNPYLALDSHRRHDRRRAARRASRRARPASNYIKAACKGVLKVMSKMGISTVASYTGAQVFEAIGLDRDLIDEYFTGTATPDRRGGARRAGRRGGRPPPAGAPRAAHRAGPPRAEVGGEYQWRREGEHPPLQPEVRVQAAARHPGQALRHLQGVHPGGRRPVGAAGHPARAAAARPAAGGPIPSTRSSRSARSCAASRPGPCPTAPSRPRPTRPWPSP